MQQDLIKELVHGFKMAVNACLDDANFIVKDGGLFYLEDVEDDANNDDNGDSMGLVPWDEEYGDLIQDPCPDVDDVETFDRYLNAEFIVHHGDESIQDRVAKRARAGTGALMGKPHVNPLFDTCEYECLLKDGRIK
jgi:hypothetical protein